MKLKLYEKMLSSKFLFSYSRVILVSFSILYFILPLVMQYIVGDTFYIYSPYQYKMTGYTLYFFVGVSLLIIGLVNKAKKTPLVQVNPLDRRIFKVFYSVNITYLIVIVLKGILFRIQGATREYLLEYISAQLIPGYGYLLLLASLSVIYIKSNKLLYYFILVCVFIDLIYQGKIFSTNAVMVTMFYLDEKNVKISLKRLLFIGIIGLSFLFLIFEIRALASGENPLMSLYSLFSEFMGVDATVGWAYDYHKINLPLKFVNFDAVLQEHYIASTGHGLALSPVAYFVGNFGDSYIYISTIFLLVIYFFYRFSTRIIGRFALFVFMYDFIHILRHGPNLFLLKSITHILFLILIVLFLTTFKKTRKQEELLTK